MSTEKLVALILAALIAAASVVFTLHMLRNYRRRRARAPLLVSTPAVVRKIEKATMDTSRHEVFAEVEYSVAGQPFTCQRWKFFAGNRLRREVDLSKLQPGAPVTVWYDPDNPADSALIVDQPTGLFVAFLPVAIVAWLALIVLLIWAARSGRA